MPVGEGAGAAAAVAVRRAACIAAATTVDCVARVSRPLYVSELLEFKLHCKRCKSPRTAHKLFWQHPPSANVALEPIHRYGSADPW